MVRWASALRKWFEVKSPYGKVYKNEALKCSILGTYGIYDHNKSFTKNTNSLHLKLYLPSGGSDSPIWRYKMLRQLIKRKLLSLGIEIRKMQTRRLLDSCSGNARDNLHPLWVNSV